MFVCIHGQQLPAKVSLPDFAYSFSPLVEETSLDTVVIDVEGCALRFGSAYELAIEISKQAKAKEPGGLGCKVNVALAANIDAAIYAARNFKGLTFIAPGEELNALGDLPIENLVIPNSKFQIPESRIQSPNSRVESPKSKDQSPNSKVQIPESDNEILETLRLWGVSTFREFAELPVAGVSERLGQDGLKLRELARGKTNRPLKLRQAAPEFRNAIELEYPIAELEPLAFILARLLNQICANLNAYALATNALEVELKLQQGATHEIKLNLPYPMRDHKVFLKLLLLDTEMRPPPAAVVGIAINCEPVKPRVLQTGLFIPLAPEPEKLELMLARLAKLVGAENIGSPELLDTHRPDAFRVKRFELKESKRKKRSKQSASSKQQSAVSLQQSENPQSEISNPQSLGFRVFRPPLRALVQAERGCPREISAWNKNKSVHGKVVGVAGPWRTSGEWWRTDMWARDEWDVAIQSSGQWAVGGEQKAQVLYRIYRELPHGAWFVEGVYD
jgi:protein ImuB